MVFTNGKKAVVHAISLGNDGLVNLDNLKTALGKIPDKLKASEVSKFFGIKV